MGSIDITRYILLIFVVVVASMSLTVHSAVEQQALRVAYVLPHSHTDVGWLDSPEGYYETQVRNIISNVVKLVPGAEERRFVMGSEMFYLWRWWRDTRTTAAERQQLKQLILSGKIELLMASYTMPDELVNTYDGIVQTLTRGASKMRSLLLEAELSPAQIDAVWPRYSWRIDPFGSNRIVSHLYSQAGLTNGSVVMRVPKKLQDEWRQERKLEFTWNPAPDAAPASVSNRYTAVTTQIMDVQYCVWDLLRQWRGPAGSDYELEQRLDDIRAEVRKRYAGYASGKLLFPMGCDFSFDDVDHFQVMDQIKQKNNQQHATPQFRYSTLSEYFLDMLNSANTSLPQYNGDLFPYNDGETAWWTGYYTSWPEVKRQARLAERLYKTSNALFSTTLAALKFSADRGDTAAAAFRSWILVQGRKALDDLQDIIAVMTHHDGVTGTSRALVNDSLLKQLIDRQRTMQSILGKAFEALAANRYTPSTDVAINVLSPGQLSQLPQSLSSSPQTYLIYNGLAQERKNAVIRLDLVIKDLQMLNTMCARSRSTTSTVENAPYQLSPLSSNGDKTTWMLFMQIPTIPALGYAAVELYYCSSVKPQQQITEWSKPVSALQEDLLVSSDLVELTICKANGKLCRFKNIATGQTSDLTQDMMFYTGETAFGQQRTGAYIFNPVSQSASTLADRVASIAYTKGSFASFITTEWNLGTGERVVQTMSLQRGSEAVDVHYSVGKVAADVQLITRFTSSQIDNNYAIYTELNGMRWSRREFSASNRVETMFVPLVSQLHIRSSNNSEKQLTVFSRQAHAAASTVPGSIEIMLQRRSTFDDGRGLDEALNPPGTAEIDFRLHLSLGGGQSSQSCVKDLQRLRDNLEFNNPLLVASVNQGIKIRYLSGSALKKPLPENVHLVSWDLVVSEDQQAAKLEHSLVRVLRLDTCDTADTQVTIDDHFGGILQVQTETNLAVSKELKTDAAGSTPLQLFAEFIRTFVTVPGQVGLQMTELPEIKDDTEEKKDDSKDKDRDQGSALISTSMSVLITLLSISIALLASVACCALVASVAIGLRQYRLQRKQQVDYYSFNNMYNTY